MRKRFLLPLIVFVGVAIGFFAVRSIEIARRENANEAIVVQNSAVAHYFATSEERIKRAVVTLPEGDTIVGLHNGTATYPYTMVAPKKVMSTVTIGSILGRKLIPSSTLDTPARLDVFATMTVSNDAYGGSLYVVLFRDRGDAALERSYVRVGDPKTVSLGTFQILESDQTIANEEYRVNIQFDTTHGKKEKSTAGIVIPVVDGLFRPEGALRS